MFGSLGIPELLLIFVVILIVFGPRRIPEIGSMLGKALAEFRKATDDLKSTIEREVRLEELKKISTPAMEAFSTPFESVSRTAPALTPVPDLPMQPELVADATPAQPEITQPETTPTSTLPTSENEEPIS